MSDFLENSNEKFTRRNFILKASAVTGFCLLNCEISAQQTETPQIAKALDDENVIHGKVNFKSGDGEIGAYLSRPKKKGHYPIVIVVSGNTFDEEYIQNTTAMLAQKGFIGVSPDIYSLQKPTMTAEEKRKVFAERITDERIFQDLQATIDYLKKQDFVNGKRIGITGFCFGGRCALMFAAESKEIDAVAPFYGNLRTPPFANRKKDPLDVLSRIKAPVQGHYSNTDAEIPLEQLKIFEESLKKQSTEVEIFTYDAPHGFFAYTRKSYNAEATQASWQRAADFFKSTLSK
jgi:carboxymethylenebutenolidase